MCAFWKCPNWSGGGGNYRQLRLPSSALTLFSSAYQPTFFCIPFCEAHWAASVFKIPLIFAEHGTAAVSGCHTLALRKPHRFHLVSSSTVSFCQFPPCFIAWSEMEATFTALVGSGFPRPVASSIQPPLLCGLILGALDQCSTGLLSIWDCLACQAAC